MVLLKTFIHNEINLLFIWLIIGLSAGLIYSLELLGVSDFDSLLVASRMRSLHISHMLYGFFPLVLSLLPFALFEKDQILDAAIIKNLKRYFVTWNLFLLLMSMTILFGDIRGLPFYDFAYWLNFILASSGLFYIYALFLAIKNYGSTRPLWVNVSFATTIIAPFLLIFLMNPSYGQVEKTLVGPHGDNTLGMSFALIPIYYLLIKLFAHKDFTPRVHILWIIPLVGYIISLIIRNFLHSLSYNEEWFFQYLTLLYIPLLYIWLKDAKISYATNPYLIISILAFLFVDVEGNILFVPEIRHMIHKNDLVIGHAHIAMGIGVAFMGLSILYHLLPNLFSKRLAVFWSIALSLITLVLTIAGIKEAGLFDININYLWLLRSFFGLLVIIYILSLFIKNLELKLESKISFYHLAGLLSDGIGGLLLILAGNVIFPLFGFHFGGSYAYVVFAFMIGVGTIHFFGLFTQGELLANISALIRVLVGSTFIALFTTNHIDNIGLLVGVYDIGFASVYWLLLRSER